MVKYSLKQIGFLIALFFCFSIKAEYILYKTNNQNEISALTQEEHKAAYEILIKYQFPTCLCYQDQIKLTKEEAELYKKSEEEFIQSKLPQNIKIKFIPTVIYELLFYNFYTVANFELNLDFINNYYIYLMQNKLHKTWNNKKYLTAMAKFNEEKDMIKLHNIINDKILGHLKDNNLFNNKNLISIIPNLIKNISKSDRLITIIEKDISIFEYIALSEYNAHILGNFLIYRGTSGRDSTHKYSYSTSHRIAYGISFLTGILHDPGACPYVYFNRPIGYVLHVNKYLYINKQANCYELFFVPPLNTLMTLSLKGEFFHVSSKIKKSYGCSGIAGGEFVADAIITESKESEEEFERKFQDYLNENVVYIKNEAGLQIQSKL